jgi:threonine dehydratase
LRAARELQEVVRRTPLLTSESLSALVGTELLLKAEHLQKTGSFKVRGAYIRLLRLAEEGARRVVAASAGNHAQGVAWAARRLGLEARIFMPESASLPKVQATRGYGAEVVLEGKNFDEALAAARSYAEESGAQLVHPFDDPWVIAGQASIALELLEEVPQPGAVVAAVGGGGLLAGLGLALKTLQPEVKLYGVQAAGAAAMKRSLEAGRPVRLAQVGTLADGTAVRKPGALTFSLVQKYADDVVVVEEEALAAAILLLLERTKQVVEGAGALPLGALLAGALPALERAVLVLGGGNIDPGLLARVIRHGLSAAGRYILIKTILLDRPGELQRLLKVIADAKANVVSVLHRRAGITLPLEQVEVEITAETRDAEHARLLREALVQRGYPLLEGGAAPADATSLTHPPTRAP